MNTPELKTNDLTRTKRLSRRTILLFAAVFAVIGVAYVLASYANTSYTSTNEWSKFQYIPGSGVKTNPTRSQSGKLLLQYNAGVTTYRAADTAMYKLTLPASTTATKITFNASYVSGGYNTVFLAAGSPSNIVWKVDKAAKVSNQNITVDLPNGPTSIYFGIKATGSAGGYEGTFPANRNLIINSYTLSGTTKTATAPPTVTLSANPASVSPGASATLSWSSTNATSCSASGAWIGDKPTAGSTTTGPLNSGSTFYLSCIGSGGSASASTAVTVSSPTGGGGSGGNANLIYEGIFDSSLSNYPTKYYREGALTYINPRQEKFHVTTADSLAGNEGNYRADILSKDIYKVGVATCTTVPVQFPDGLATVPRDSWLQFAQAKTPKVDYQSWSMGVSSWYNGGANSFVIGFQGFAGNGKNPGSPAWVSPPMDNAIHTFSVCTNNAADTTGTIHSIWMDGVRQTFNQGTAKGKQSLSGFPIIKGVSSYPLVLNLYTGGSPVPSTLIHGVPLISTMGSDANATPPMPPGGWRSF